MSILNEITEQCEKIARDGLTPDTVYMTPKKYNDLLNEVLAARQSGFMHYVISEQITVKMINTAFGSVSVEVRENVQNDVRVVF